MFSSSPPMNTKQLTLLVVLLGTSGITSRAQARSAQAEDPSNLFSLFYCRDNVQPGAKICKAVLPASLDTKKSKAGDHVSIKMDFIEMPPTADLGKQPISMLDATIIEVQPAMKGRRSA